MNDDTMEEGRTGSDQGTRSRSEKVGGELKGVDRKEMLLPFIESQRRNGERRQGSTVPVDFQGLPVSG